MSKKIKDNKKVMSETKTVAELDAYIEQATSEFKTIVDGIDTVEELQSLESDLMKDMDSYQEYIGTVEYPIVDSVTFDGITYSRDEVVTKLADVITDQDVEWQFAKGIYELISAWRVKESITYAMMDTTLRILSTSIKFRGYQKCVDANIINELISPQNTGYFKDAAELIILHTKHNFILSKIDEIQTLGMVVEGNCCPECQCGDECQCGSSTCD